MNEPLPHWDRIERQSESVDQRMPSLGGLLLHRLKVPQYQALATQRLEPSQLRTAHTAACGGELLQNGQPGYLAVQGDQLARLIMAGMMMRPKNRRHFQRQKNSGLIHLQKADQRFEAIHRSALQ